MYYKLTITNILPDLINHVQDDTYTLLLSPFENTLKLLNDPTVADEEEARQIYIRSMLFNTLDINYDMTLTKVNQEEQLLIAYVDHNNFDGYFIDGTRLIKQHKYKVVDDDVLFGSEAYDMVQEKETTDVYDVTLKFNNTLEVIVSEDYIEQFKGKMHLMVTRVIGTQLPVEINIHY